MTGMTYDTLVQAIQDYAERSDSAFVDNIPSFIALAENRLAMEVKPLGFVRTVTGVLSQNILKKPARWRRTKSFSVIVNDGRKFLFERSFEYCKYYAADAGPDVPRYYSDYGYEYFFIAPTLSATYPFELSYYERPLPLSKLQQTSWTTQYAPQLLLYASLLEAQPFLKNSERIAEFQGLYDRALQALIAEDQGRLTDASA